MPHIRLEYSANIKETIIPEKLFSSCFQILANTISADICRCQGRAVCQDVFYVGKGSDQEAFIYLQLIILKGRSESQLQEAGTELTLLLKDYFATSLKELKLQMAVHFIEISPDRYFKVETKTST